MQRYDLWCQKINVEVNPVIILTGRLSQKGQPLFFVKALFCLCVSLRITRFPCGYFNRWDHGVPIIF